MVALGGRSAAAVMGEMERTGEFPPFACAMSLPKVFRVRILSFFEGCYPR